MKRHYASTYRKAAAIQEIVLRHYQQGRHDRSYRWVWQHHIYPQFCICFRTFAMLKNMNIHNV